MEGFGSLDAKSLFDVTDALAHLPQDGYRMVHHQPNSGARRVARCEERHGRSRQGVVTRAGCAR
jgi:hypothetical protein